MPATFSRRTGTRMPVSLARSFSSIAPSLRSLSPVHALCQPTHCQVIELYRHQRQSAVKPTNRVLVAVLKACGGAADLAAGKQVHADLLGRSVKPTLFVGNGLVEMYAKCGSLEDARRVFDTLPSRNVVTWNFMIAGYAKHCLGREALSLYGRMQQEGITHANDVTFVSLLRACVSIGALCEGKKLHLQIQERKLEANVIVGNCLVDMYAKCGSIEDARRLFDRLPTKDVVTWNAMLGGYARYGLGHEALSLFGSMQRHGIVVADKVTFVCLLKACASVAALSEGKDLHFQIQERGLEADVVVGSSLVDMYAKCSSLGEARKVFDSLHTKNLVTWNAMLAGYAQHGLAEEALALYASMQQEEDTHAAADHVTFVCLLKACAGARALHEGKQLHLQIQERRLESDLVVGSSLLDMYTKCGSLEDARTLFDRLPVKSVVAWNAMIAGYAQHGPVREGFTLYKQMQQEGVYSAENGPLVSLLKACSRDGGLGDARHLHIYVQEKGLDVDVVVGSSLVDMYAKCGSLEDARKVFDQMPSRDVVTWTIMIAAYAQHGLGEEALNLYTRMQLEGISLADNVTFVCLLKACASIGPSALHQGQQLHLQIQERGFEAYAAVGSSLVDMYAKCGSLHDARRVFDGLLGKDVVTWNAMIAGYVKYGFGQEALALYANVKQEGIHLADNVSFVLLLKACACLGAVGLCKGKEVHSQIQERGLEADVVIGRGLVDMYAKCGSVQEARSMFDKALARDAMTWNTMLAGYAQHGLVNDAIALYTDMPLDCVGPSTFVCLLKACASAGAIHQGKQLHLQLQDRGLDDDLIAGTALVDMYAKCGDMDHARRVFDKLPSKGVATWNAMISGCVQHGLGQEALLLFTRMQQEGICPADSATFSHLLNVCASLGALSKGREVHCTIQERGLESDAIIGSSLVDMYAKCGALDEARSVFDRLPMKDLVTWTAMISGYDKQDLGQEALGLFTRMQLDGVHPTDQVAFICLLRACASTGALRQGKQLHSLIENKGLEANILVGSSLVDMYAKCGSMEDARNLFDRLPTRDVVTWTAMLNGYGQQNDVEAAIQCFKAMQHHGVEPNGATFLCLLVACSHAGLVKEGQQYFKMMKELYSITPSVHHYNSMVDLLGRSGILDEAENMLESIPVKDNDVGWTSLLSACKSHGDIERGERCFNRLVEMGPGNAPAYALLASIYSDAGMWSDVERIESLRKSAGAYKMPARACIEINSTVHSFIVGGDRDDTSSKIKSVNLRLKEVEGHAPQTQLLPKPVSDTGNEDTLCGHAEKLALAYGLLNTPEGTTLLVTKNLRMCNDCHSGTKIMSKLEKREIVVRDAHRVHHFVDGFCSCGDRH